jgi:hypothetical protein
MENMVDRPAVLRGLAAEVRGQRGREVIRFESPCFEAPQQLLYICFFPPPREASLEFIV